MDLIARRLGVRPPEYRGQLHQYTSVAMSDGVRLRTQRYGPRDLGAYPSILLRTPYGIGWHPPLFMAQLAARFFAHRGYQVILQDTRGRYGSEGEFYPFLNEERDGRDTLEWISGQPWFDGNLALLGPSYLGYTQWAVAAGAPEYVKAMVPIVTSSDFYGLFYPGGAFSLITALRWAAGNGGRRGRRSPERRLPSGARHRPIREASRAVGRPARFFEDWADHPELDEYWERINHTEARESTGVPALQIAGTYDIFCGPQLSDFSAGGPESCLDLGPFAHGTYAISPRRLGWKQAGALRMLPSTLAFLDHHLKGAPLERQRVRRYVQAADRWEEADAWPPSEAVPERLYLRSDGRLDAEPPGGDETPDPYLYDPEDPVPSLGGTFLGLRCGPADQRALAQRGDVQVYDTSPLARPLHLAGPVKLRLFATSDAAATDFTAKLVHLPADPSRPALNICDGIRRLEQSPDPAEPVEIDLWHASICIPPGDILRLEVSSSCFPRYDAHPNLSGPAGRATRTQPARQALHHSSDAPSCLQLWRL